MDNEAQSIEEAAREMIRRFGTQAGQEVELRVHELREIGEEETLKLWLEIHIRVTELLARGGNGSVP